MTFLFQALKLKQKITLSRKPGLKTQTELMKQQETGGKMLGAEEEQG